MHTAMQLSYEKKNIAPPPFRPFAPSRFFATPRF